MPGLGELKHRMEMLVSESNRNEETLLDVPFSAEEVSEALGRLKNRKTAGPDGLVDAEHI